MPRAGTDHRPGIRHLLEVGSSRLPRCGSALPRRPRQEIEALCSRWSATHAGRPPAEIEGLGPGPAALPGVRDRSHLDPAVLRSALAADPPGKALPVVNSAVEVCNLCSVVVSSPIGLYDDAKIRGDVTLQAGRTGSPMPGFERTPSTSPGGPFSSTRGARSGTRPRIRRAPRVTEDTTSLFMVIFAPAGYCAVARCGPRGVRATTRSSGISPPSRLTSF
jgi:hypothetical protein